MRCPRCQHDNPFSAKFCHECGVVLARRCPNCGTEITPTMKFCGDCGAALGTTVTDDQKPPKWGTTAKLPVDAPVAMPEVPDGERKTVTALFADIKGSMELIEDLDPEDARAIVDPALTLMMNAVRHYDGYVAQSTGDGIFALFGAPLAHEDHPQRALYAALRMQEDLKRYSDTLRARGQAPLSIRVGVNTGEVVVRSIKTDKTHAEYAPIGHSTSLAARLQTLASPGSIAISETMRKLVEGYFQFTTLGPARIKGVSEPLNICEVTGLGPLRTRLQRSAQRGLSKFVGREAEMQQLRRALDLARAGHGQIVAAVGDAGVGKSRLFYEFKAIAGSHNLLLETFSVSHGKASAYLPVIELLRNYFAIAPEDDERKKREKITGKVLALDRALEDVLPTAFALLAIGEPRATGGGPIPLDQQVQRRRTCEALKRLLVRESLNQPLILMFEDLHWVDEESQALLQMLADSIGTAPILMLVNYRPEYRHDWGNKSYYVQLRLDPLGRESVQEMLAALLGRGSAELQALNQAIIARTEGNPFFLEEIVQSLFEQEVLVRDGGAIKLGTPFSEAKLPATVQGLLASRIDRLPGEQKELLQTLAVIGKEFPLSLVRRVASKADDELSRMLSSLQVAEFIYEQPAFPEVEYTFKHALTQEVAYNSVLVERRKLLHERIGTAIEEIATDQIGDHVAELAHHYSRSDSCMKAARYLHLAAAQLYQRTAFAEAKGLAGRGLAILDTASDGPERTRHEIALQITLGRCLGAVSSPAAPEVGRAYLRAQELCERIGDNRRLFEALIGLRLHYQVKAEGRRVRDLCEQLYSMALRDGDPVLLRAAHALLGASCLWFGEPESARSHGAESLAVVDPEDPFGAQFAAGMPALSCALWLLGFPEQARRVADEWIGRARAMHNPLTMILALSQGWDLNRFLRDPIRGREHADAALVLCGEHGMQAIGFSMTSYRGWALVEDGYLEEGIEELRRGLAGRDRLGMGQRNSQMLMLVEAHLKMNQPERAAEVLEEAFTRMGQTCERSCEPEQHRLKGELLLRNPAAMGRAEESFGTAIEIARRQNAKSWELRATVSLARLLAGQGSRKQARAVLGEIYGWFTEGFDTPDLKDAKALLEQL